MKLSEAEEIVLGAKIAEPETLTFFAAVIIFVGGEYDWDLDLIHKATGYGYDDVALILSNWYENEILVDGKLQMEIEGDELSNVVEVSLIAMAGAGEVIRLTEEKMKLNFFNPTTRKFESMNTKKTLNDHLFEQLDRLSNADADNIELEMNKASQIIAVSSQILDVARLKLDIIAAGENVITNFAEIDNSEQKQLGNGEEGKKKL